MKRRSLTPLRAAALLALAACSSGPDRPDGPPRNQADACAILDHDESWGPALRAAERRWGAPPEVVLAIIQRESSFRHDARPPKKYAAFGLISTGHVSSAYGYSQALDGTWDWYRKETGAGGADREEFEDAVDFIGWYLTKTEATNGVPKRDAFQQYLAYHEGHRGFASGRWQGKDWLLRAAAQVAALAQTYRVQLAGCRDRLA